MPAVGMTDSGNLFGALEFSQYCAKAGVQPIIGCQIGLPARNDKPGAPAEPLSCLRRMRRGWLISSFCHRTVFSIVIRQTPLWGWIPYVKNPKVDSADRWHARPLFQMLAEGRKKRPNAGWSDWLGSLATGWSWNCTAMGSPLKKRWSPVCWGWQTVLACRW